MDIGNIRINFSLEERVIGDNLVKLYQRERGIKFYVKNGKLKKVEGIFRRIYYFFLRKKVQAEVSQTIATLFQKLSLKKMKYVKSASTHEVKTREEVIRGFFQELLFGKMSHISSKAFDRATITPEIEDALAPTLVEKREAWKRLKAKDGKSQACRKASYEYKVVSVRLAQKLGIEFEKISVGDRPSYCGRNRFGKKLVVFRPKRECAEEKGISRIGNFFRWIFGIQLPQCYKSCQEHLSEVGASIVNKQLALNLVPETHIETFESVVFREKDAELKPTTKEGSCHVYKKGFRVASEALPVPFASSVSPFTRLFQRIGIAVKKKKITESLPQQEFEQLVIFDYLIGNFRRDAGNWKVKDDKKKILATGNDLSFSFVHPSIDNINQYRWRLLPQAREAFSKESVTLIKRVKKKKDTIFSELSSVMPDAKAMEERIQVLSDFVEGGKTPYALAQIKTKKAFERHFKTK